MANRYYLINKLHLMREFNQAISHAEAVFVSHYGAGLADSIMQQTRQEFESLLFHLPYIGGDENPLTGNLVQSAWFLALYRVLKSYGKSLQEAGEVSYEVAEALSHRSNFLTQLVSRLRLSRLAPAHLKERAAESQQHQYPEDWVYSVVDGDGKTFDFGVDYTECGICKFFHAQGADEFTPYMCLVDYPLSRAQGLDMERSSTLAEGQMRCDIRFKRAAPGESGR